MGLISQGEARKFEAFKLLLCSTLESRFIKIKAPLPSRFAFYTPVFMDAFFPLLCACILALDTILTSKRFRHLGVFVDSGLLQL